MSVKTTLAATCAALVMSAGFAMAQGSTGTSPGQGAVSGQGMGQGMGPGMMRRGDLADDQRGPAFTREDLAALVDARIAAIKAGLKLTAEQDRLLDNVVRAMREGIDQTVATTAAMARPTDLAGRLQLRAERLSMRATRLRSFADALKPFEASLDERQKRLLPYIVRAGGGRELMMHDMMMRRMMLDEDRDDDE